MDGNTFQAGQKPAFDGDLHYGKKGDAKQAVSILEHLIGKNRDNL
jgi:hypothetical protein